MDFTTRSVAAFRRSARSPSVIAFKKSPRLFGLSPSRAIDSSTSCRIRGSPPAREQFNCTVGNGADCGWNAPPELFFSWKCSSQPSTEVSMPLLMNSVVSSAVTRAVR